MLIVINAHHDLVEFTIPESFGGDEWALLIDSNLEDNKAEGSHKTGQTYDVTSRSLLLFALKSQNAQSGRY